MDLSLIAVGLWLWWCHAVCHLAYVQCTLGGQLDLKVLEVWYSESFEIWMIRISSKFRPGILRLVIFQKKFKGLSPFTSPFLNLGACHTDQLGWNFLEFRRPLSKQAGNLIWLVMSVVWKFSVRSSPLNCIAWICNFIIVAVLFQVN